MIFIYGLFSYFHMICYFVRSIIQNFHNRPGSYLLLFQFCVVIRTIIIQNLISYLKFYTLLYWIILFYLLLSSFIAILALFLNRDNLCTNIITLSNNMLLLSTFPSIGNLAVLSYIKKYSIIFVLFC